MALTLLAVCLSFIAALVLWGGLVLLTDGTASLLRVSIASVLTGVYLSHYIHLKAAKE